jgi:hypothetical protein
MSTFFKALFGVDNWLEPATVTTDNGDLSFPDLHLKKRQPRDRYQTADASGVRITCVQPGSVRRAWNLVGLLFNNGTDDGSWRVRAANADTITTPHYDSNYISGQTFSEDAIHLYVARCLNNTYPVYVCKFATDPLKTISSLTGDFTLEGLIRPKNLHGSTDQVLWYIEGTGHSFEVSIRQNLGIVVKTNDIDRIVTGAGSISLGSWVPIAVTWNSSTDQLELFVNGLSVDVSATGLTQPCGSSLQIFQGYGTTPASGDYGELRIYDEIRSDANILAWAGSRLSGTPPVSLKYRYQLEEGTGTSFVNERDGTGDSDLLADVSNTINPLWIYPTMMWPSPSLDDLDRKHSVLWNQPGAYSSHMWVDVRDLNAAEGFNSIGKLFVSGAWFPSQNISYGSNLFGFQDPGVQRTLRTGITTIQDGVSIPSLSIQMQSRSKDEMYQLAYEIGRVVGNSHPLLFIRDPSDENYLHQGIYYGLLQGNIAPIERAYELYTMRLNLKGLT